VTAELLVLDVSKAFDKVLINGLIAKLIKEGAVPQFLPYAYYITD